MSEWDEIYARQLPGLLNERGDLTPPWVKFPTLDFGSIGWRMGAGEDYLNLWRYFIERLPEERETRISYLRRHAPAPYTWVRELTDCLGLRDSSSPRQELAALGLVAEDASYPVWLQEQQGQLSWPWLRGMNTPEEALQHRTREFSFQVRQLLGARQQGELCWPEIPGRWVGWCHVLTTGNVPGLGRRDGMEGLVLALCRPPVITPWELGCPAQGNQGEYGDAFEVWLLRAFDDNPSRMRAISPTPPPEDWRLRMAGWDWGP